jgi:hypothetical protein
MGLAFVRDCDNEAIGLDGCKTSLDLSYRLRWLGRESLERVPLQRINRGIAAKTKGSNIVHDREATAAISTYRPNAPKMTQPEISTHQGILPPDRLLIARPLR